MVMQLDCSQEPVCFHRLPSAYIGRTSIKIDDLLPHPSLFSSEFLIRWSIHCSCFSVCVRALGKRERVRARHRAREREREREREMEGAIVNGLKIEWLEWAAVSDNNTSVGENGEEQKSERELR